MGCGNSTKDVKNVDISRKKDSGQGKGPEISATPVPVVQVLPINMENVPIAVEDNSLQKLDNVDRDFSTKLLIGSYQLTEKVCSIPYGVLYKCVHVTSGLQRGLKVIKVKHSEVISLNPKHLESELSVLKSLQHPNILQIYDLFYNKQEFYVVMEPWPGKSLIDSLTQMPHLTEGNVASIIFQILSAVNYCHLKKILHRDLNPKVIFIENPLDPKIKIAEFGASAFIDPENSLAGKSHSKKFTAPEVFENYYNEKCDIWSVGIIFYLLLTGGMPFYDESHPENPVSEIKPEELAKFGVSEQAVDLLLKMVKKEFKSRISANEALEHEWFKNVLKGNSDVKVINTSLKRLKNYKKSTDFQDSIREFIAGQILSFEESINVVKAFQSIDSNWDGKISKEELLAHYKKSMNDEKAEETLKRIFSNADRDQSGYIEYNEFVKASMKNRYLMSVSNIEKAFKVLDTDHSSKLSKSELQALLGDSADKTLMQLIAEADTNGDGEIDFTEFYSLLRKKYDS